MLLLSSLFFGGRRNPAARLPGFWIGSRSVYSDSTVRSLGQEKKNLITVHIEKKDRQMIDFLYANYDERIEREIPWSCVVLS